MAIGRIVEISMSQSSQKCKKCGGSGKTYEDCGPYESGWRVCTECNAALPKGGSGTAPLKPDSISPKPANPGAKYLRLIRGRNGQTAMVDIYDVLHAFKVTDQAIGHAIKKLFCPGARGHKSRVEDLEEAIVSIRRAIENNVVDDPSNQVYEG